MEIKLLDSIRIAQSRPAADHGVEQYLMTAESLRTQIGLLKGRLANAKSILLLGDDDHLSILLALQLDATIVVVENDKRVIKSLEDIALRCGIVNLDIIPHDLRYQLNKDLTERFDACILNPPYSSKNEAFGIKVWISRSMQALRKGGVGLVILPVQIDLPWSLNNMTIVQAFLAEIGAPLTSIEKDIHTYYDLPDSGLMSSNIWFTKTRDLPAIKNTILKDIPQGISLYR